MKGILSSRTRGIAEGVLRTSDVKEWASRVCDKIAGLTQISAYPHIEAAVNDLDALRYYFSPAEIAAFVAYKITQALAVAEHERLFLAANLAVELELQIQHELKYAESEAEEEKAQA